MLSTSTDDQVSTPGQISEYGTGKKTMASRTFTHLVIGVIMAFEYLHKCDGAGTHTHRDDGRHRLYEGQTVFIPLYSRSFQDRGFAKLEPFRLSFFFSDEMHWPLLCLYLALHNLDRVACQFDGYHSSIRDSGEHYDFASPTDLNPLYEFEGPVAVTNLLS